VNTPIVELSRITEGMRGAVYAKIEFLNPGASKKDRIARQMIDDALADGRVKPGQTVLEVTSGNTGTGLAIVCAVRGLKFVAVMSAGNSSERRRMIEGLGGRVEVVPQAPGSPAGQVSGADLEPSRWTRELAKVEGIFGGFSSGANLAAAMRLLQASQTAGEPARVVFTVNDSGLRYLSTDLWP